MSTDKLAGHTAGPWDVHETSVGLEIHPLSDEDGLIVIADVQGTPQNKANARLIAAAPELLEASKDAFATLLRLRERGTIGDSPSIRLLGAAIAKAERGSA